VAASTYTTNLVNVNVGDPTWATFYFESVPTYTGPGNTGATELIVQCRFSRAELITNAQIYGEQAVSQFFPVNCTETTTTVNGYRLVSATLNNTPFTVNLTMNSYGGTPTPLTVTVGATSWQSRPCGSGCTDHRDAGSAQITE
jgi:hypothetical protein